MIDPCPHVNIGGAGGGWVRCYDCGSMQEPGGAVAVATARLLQAQAGPLPPRENWQTEAEYERMLRHLQEGN